MARTRGSISKPRRIEAESLREVLKPIHDKLVKAGLDEAQLPTNEAIVSKLLDWIDEDKVKEWVKKYADAMKG